MISVVVVTRNRAALLGRCLDSLRQQSSRDYELIVVDDGSCKEQRKRNCQLIRGRAGIRYFFSPPRGRGTARNLGLSKARGTIIAFTDDDCIVPKDWLAQIALAFRQHHEASAVGGPVVNLDKNRYGEAASLLNFSSWLDSRPKGFVQDIPTANAAYLARDIRGIRFPGSELDIDYEDSFFNASLRAQGRKILFVPDVVVYHQAGIQSRQQFLSNQRRKGLSFLVRGYHLHGFFGRVLVRWRWLNLMCPRLTLVLLRCARSPRSLWKFTTLLPLLCQGEFKRGMAILNGEPSLP
jgi:glycosyltransferase involved in cell wall biosynthesis